MKTHQYERAIPHFVSAARDYNNVESVAAWSYRFPDKSLALRLLAETQPIGKPLFISKTGWLGLNSLSLLARRYLLVSLGPNCFEETFHAYGNFEEVDAAAPYLHILNAIVRLSWLSEDLEGVMQVLPHHRLVYTTNFQLLQCSTLR